MELSELFHIPPVEIRVIPNGVDIAQFHKLEAQTITFTDALNLLSAEPLLLLPVRITRRKNIELALQTLAVLRERLPQAVLVVTGPLGPHNPANRQYFQELIRLRSRLGIEEAAHFLAERSNGFLPDPIIADLFHLADALILPSYEEGFGIPILEAGLAGIPVFCSDIPPLRALGGSAANYFSPFDAPEQVAELLFRLLPAGQTYALRRHVRKNFTWQMIYQNQIAPLLRTLESKRFSSYAVGE
jgi:glycosyltransferase involved in cell wall biosynthesis